MLLSCTIGQQEITDDNRSVAKKYNSLGNEYMGRGDYLNAAELFRKASVSDPRPEYTYNSGVAFQKATLYEKAIEKYQQTLDQDPKFIEAYYNTALCYERLGQLEYAADYYERYKKAINDKNATDQ